MKRCVLGVSIGSRVESQWIVQDISYSQDEKHIYLHMSRQIGRRNPEFRVEKFQPFEKVDYV